MNKPKNWSYKSGAKKGQLRPASKRYLSFKLKSYHKLRKTSIREGIIKEQIREEQEKGKYRRQSYVLTAYYGSEKFFDWRVSILNSKKTNTRDYLKKVLTNRWEKWAIGDRSKIWSFVIEAFENENIDSEEAKKFEKENVVVWEKR